MIKLIFEENAPSSEVLINLPELEIVKWLKYITNYTCHKEGIYEKLIKQIEEDNQDKILIVVNDNSIEWQLGVEGGIVKRCFICVYTKDELKST